jgi:hypothetical protein
VTFERLFAFVVLGHGRRTLLWFAVTTHPAAEWLARQITEAFPWETAPRAFALALLCFTWRGTVFGPDEWESNVIGDGHGGLLSSLHIVQCVLFSLAFLDVGAFLTLPRVKPDDTTAERRSIAEMRWRST